MDHKNTQTNSTILKKISEIELRIAALEKLLNQNISKFSQAPLPIKKYDHSGKKQVSYKSKTNNEFLVTVDSELNLIDESDKTYTVSEEVCVKNMLVMGDMLLISVSGDTVVSIKVSQRAKRTREDALVTAKDNHFYAVSKYATHKLLSYDVLSRGVLKGFEVKVLLPKDNEKQAKVALIDFVESSGTLSTKKVDAVSDSALTNNTPTRVDMRVLEEDDLV